MEALKKEIGQVFAQFMKEEMGNRLSQFALIGFRGAIFMAIDKFEKRLEEKGKGGIANA